MAFWRSETMRERMPAETLVEPYQEQHVETSAYELCMGSEAFVTSTADKVKRHLDNGESLQIPPGQFALLLTDERIKVPLDAIAFISIKFGFKRRGLINVSGFHVDPGFEGRLKFSVYNAGSSPITINQGDRVFLIWYANLDGTTAEAYSVRPDQNTISSDDQNVMHGEIASPAELKSQLDTLKHYDVHRKWMLGVIAGSVVAIAVRLWIPYFTVPSPIEIEKLQTEIKDVRQKISEFENQTDGQIEKAADTGNRATNN